MCGAVAHGEVALEVQVVFDELAFVASAEDGEDAGDRVGVFGGGG